MLQIGPGSSIRKVGKSIIGKTAARNRGDFLYYANWYKKRNNSLKIPLLFCHYFYKTIREYTTSTKKTIVNVNDYKMKIIPQDQGISQELLMFKTHEPLVTKIIKQQVKKGMICFEIGCNLGYYAILESKLVGKNGQIIAFEPSPINYEHFKYNVSLNNISNIQSYNYAIGDLDTTIDFLVSERSNCSRIAVVNSPHSEGKLISVPLMKLDTFTEKHCPESIDLMRMDIEGYEYNAYNGMSKTIKQFKPDLLIETHLTLMGVKKTTQFLNKLKNDGYEIKYYIPRLAELPWLASMKDVEEMEINKLIKSLPKQNAERGIGAICFNLYLVNKGSKK